MATVHAQPPAVWSAIVAAPPADATFSAVGDTANWHGAGCSEMANFWPFTSMVAERAATSALAATVNGNDPLPCPLGVPVSATHDALAVADHVQSRSVVTETLPLPPAAGKLAGAPVIVTAQRGGVGPVTEVEVEEPQAMPPRAQTRAATHKR